eukprot:TRINITY_DN5870_c0_g1_i1.p1 TRINITY_DN5870_c0_g1~~TRINITY_DN5870_c0_g1_i1.p1  ORF type:complete len:316 (+),score=35.58 TRINITY_DN5870_c0_g1_i1:501-1448(+)
MGNPSLYLDMFDHSPLEESRYTNSWPSFHFSSWKISWLFCRMALLAGERALFLIILLLVCRGWRIAKPSLSYRVIRATILTFTLMVLSCNLVGFYHLDLLFLCLWVAYFYLLPIFLANLSENTSRLGAQQTWLHAFRNSLDGEEVSTIDAKVETFHCLRIVCFLVFPAIYTTGLLLKVMISKHDYWHLSWIRTLDDELQQLLFAMILCWILRPRSNVNIFWCFPNIHVDLAQIEATLFQWVNEEDGLTVIEYPSEKKTIPGRGARMSRGNVKWKEKENQHGYQIEIDNRPCDVGSQALVLGVPLKQMGDFERHSN